LSCEKEIAIRVQDLCKVYDSKDGCVTATDHISFEVEKGDIYGIIGLSGAGKSTLVRCLNLLETPTDGIVEINGQCMQKLSPSELRLARRDIGMIFQHFNLLMQRTVLDNVCFPLEIAGMKKKEAREKAMGFLETVGLSEKAKAYPAKLSGGQKQRVAIARVLASDPKVLLCDEATSALDPQTTKSILSLLKRINEEYGITIVLITHEMAVVQEICKHVLVLENGKLQEAGTVKEIFRNPKTEATKRLLLHTDVELPKSTNGKMVRLTFTEASVSEPILSNAIIQYKAPLNIIHAEVQSLGGVTHGQMIVQLPEDEHLAVDIMRYFKEKNVTVEEWNENDN